ncbi:YggT family protein [Terrihabitans sp. B22-R8]|uniref:YggT family protein n=1 Tax=Terrihabitans sp. B22-R8 TaxID=3425128 RepID=UPI00403D38FC
MNALFILIDAILSLVFWVIVLSAVMSWLIALNIANPRNQYVGMVWDTLVRLTEPVLNPIRRFLPNLGGIDLSPVIVLLLISFLRNLLWWDIRPALAF